jgi:hypothetical protein
MYRHIAVLAEASVLEVVEEKRVRGTIERSYRVRPEHAVVDPAARAAMTREDHQRAFTTFMSSLIADFSRYLTAENADPIADGVVYRQAAVWVTDDEFTAMVEEIERAVVTRIGPTGGDGRTRRIVSLVVVPDQPASNPAPEAGTEQAGE